MLRITEHILIGVVHTSGWFPTSCGFMSKTFKVRMFLVSPNWELGLFGRLVSSRFYPFPVTSCLNLTKSLGLVHHLILQSLPFLNGTDHLPLFTTLTNFLSPFLPQS